MYGYNTPEGPEFVGRDSPLDAEIIEEAIRSAIATEHEGHRFYREKAETSENALVQALLTELAEDEFRHAQFFSSLQKEPAMGVVEATEPLGGEVASIEARLKEIFHKMDATLTGSADESHEEVLKQAIELEKVSYDTYNELFEKSFGAAKEVFDKMRREEYEHLVALQNVLTYLSKTGRWLDMDESKRWNWMNI